MARDKNPRNIELHILKNRNGRAGSVIPFKYTLIVKQQLTWELKKKEWDDGRGLRNTLRT